MNFNFYKYQGLGNDFIILDCINKADLYEKFLQNNDTIINKLCNRNYGIGADGVILLMKSANQSSGIMRIFNSDGSEPEMCGNGIRCLIAYMMNYNLLNNKKEIIIDTRAGLISASITEEKNFKINMGLPILDPLKIPTTLNVDNSGIPAGVVEIEGEFLNIYAASMGNPHMVTFVDDINKIPFEKWGGILERHETFPNKTNVHFVQILDNSNIIVKVWERGCGPTLACGTGACASIVVSSRLNLTAYKANVYLPGGKLMIDWPNLKGPIYMEGPALEVFTGNIIL